MTPQFSLWNVVQFAVAEASWGTPESYAGVLLVEGIARHLGIPSEGPVIHARRIDRLRLAQLAAPLAAVGPARLRAAARAAWLDLFGEPIVPIVDRK